jgi:hypothetical protein
MDEPTPTIFVVDDDTSVRCALARLIRSLGMQVGTFATGQEFQVASGFGNAMTADRDESNSSLLEFVIVMASFCTHRGLLLPLSSHPYHGVRLY